MPTHAMKACFEGLKSPEDVARTSKTETIIPKMWIMMFKVLIFLCVLLPVSFLFFIDCCLKRTNLFLL